VFFCEIINKLIEIRFYVTIHLTSPARIVCLPAIYVKVPQYIEFIRI
jgi:hypothetical protein